MLRVKTIYPNIQTEGSFAGVPSIFIVLSDNHDHEMKIDDVVHYLGTVANTGLRHISIVGEDCEPLKQQAELVKLIKHVARSFSLVVHTTGSVLPADGMNQWVDEFICTPDEKKFNPNILDRLAENSLFLMDFNGEDVHKTIQHINKHIHTESERYVLTGGDEAEMRSMALANGYRVSSMLSEGPGLPENAEKPEIDISALKTLKDAPEGK